MDSVTLKVITWIISILHSVYPQDYHIVQGNIPEFCVELE